MLLTNRVHYIVYIISSIYIYISTCIVNMAEIFFFGGGLSFDRRSCRFHWRSQNEIDSITFFLMVKWFLMMILILRKLIIVIFM